MEQHPSPAPAGAHPGHFSSGSVTASFRYTCNSLSQFTEFSGLWFFPPGGRFLLPLAHESERTKFEQERTWRLPLNHNESECFTYERIEAQPVQST